MKQALWVRPFMFVCLVAVSLSAVADTQYISSLKAKVFKDPNFKSSIVAQLTKGQQVEVNARKGVWVNIAFQGKEGWVSKFLVKKNLPLDSVSVFTGNEESKLKDVRRRTSAITTAAAARGLADVAREDNKKYPENLAGLNYMESFKVSSQALKIFEKPLDQGGK